MNILLVTYDLIKNKDYSKLYQALDDYDRWRFQDSAWIIKTSSSMHDVFNQLSNYVDLDDKLMVIKIDTAIWSESLTKEFSYWIKNN